MKFSKDAKIGLVVIGAIVILIWGVNFLKGFNVFSSEQVFYARYERVDGLKKSSSVTLKGYKVGQIKSIKFSSASADHLLVEFAISNQFKLPANSVARIESADIMGTKEIKIIPGKGKTLLQTGDTIKGSIEGDLKEQVSMQMLPLKKKAEKLMSGVDSVLTVIQYIFNENTRDNLRKSFGSIEQTFKKLENASGTLDTIMTGQKSHFENIFANVDSITGNLKDNNKNVSTILSNFSNISDSLSATDIAQTINNAKATLKQTNEILEKINSGKGSMGLLINNDTLYTNLEAASNGLTNLLIDVKNNPKKYMHFSLFDTGKTVYMDSEKSQKKKDKENHVYYKVQIMSSASQIPLDDTVFKGYRKIEEIYFNGKYKYTIGETQNYKDIIRQLKKIRDDFPDAFVIKISPEN
ncbi:MlaD family protein [Labilibaculum euxinus]|uniref:MCE family protein n=1 Tax=Labilibaculum euxinus TaxID=2686357 RepID=A0A7M4D6N0_9BACT|nr:MlaD family protein [Labilibaculum euxinus]MUP38309.1 MCE family protein [Labilibaculum euxinus]MVB07514.1 MCE family protein [Labilibaculum euxinus]